MWWNPKFGATANLTVQGCITCRNINSSGRVKVPLEILHAPLGLFRHLQLDYISMPPCKGYKDMLVVVDKFSQWVEAYPTRRATATHGKDTGEGHHSTMGFDGTNWLRPGHPRHWSRLCRSQQDAWNPVVTPLPTSPTVFWTSAKGESHFEGKTC